MCVRERDLSGSNLERFKKRIIVSKIEEGSVCEKRI